MTMSDQIPDGFAPWTPISPFMLHLIQISPIYWRESDWVFGVRVTHGHGNPIGMAHGGFLATLADTVLSQVLVRTLSVAVATVQLSVEYLNPVKEGDWLEAHVRIDKPGKRLIHATCQLEVAGRVTLKVNGVFAVISQSPPPMSAPNP